MGGPGGLPLVRGLGHAANVSAFCDSGGPRLGNHRGVHHCSPTKEKPLIVFSTAYVDFMSNSDLKMAVLYFGLQIQNSIWSLNFWSINSMLAFCESLKPSIESIREMN